MRIVPTKKVARKMMQLLDSRQVSSIINFAIMPAINASLLIPDDVESLRTEAVEMNQNIQQGGFTGYSDDQIMILLMVSEIIKPYLDDDVWSFCTYEILKKCRVFDAEEFMNNPYIKNIDFHEKHYGDYELCYDEFMPYELSIYGPPEHLQHSHIDVPCISCFSKTLKYPALKQKSIRSTWMSITPNEVCTMADAIANAKGKVLTLGCGIGYFAYMASLKDEVESVTIIECEQDVIDLFETHILPQFQYKEKIHIIKADAIEYMRELTDGEFDYCFADIWIGMADIEPYFAVKEIGRTLRKTKIDYWIEKSFAAYLSSSIWTEMVQAFSKAIETDELNIPDMPEGSIEERIQNYVHRLLKKVEITTPDQIDAYLMPENIITLINKTKIKF